MEGKDLLKGRVPTTFFRLSTLLLAGGLFLCLLSALAYALEGHGDFAGTGPGPNPEKDGRPGHGAEAGSVPWCLDSDFKLEGLSGSRDQDHAFEDLDLWLNMKIQDEGREKIYWSTTMGWTRGQVLLYPWFFDLSSLKGSVTASGFVSQKRLHVTGAKLDGPITLRAKDVDIPLDRKGSEGLESLLASLEIGSIEMSGRLERLYPVLVKEPFSDSHPVVNKVDPAGSINMETRGHVARLGCTADILYSGSPLFRGLVLDISWPFKDEGCLPGGLSWKEFYLRNLLPPSLLDSHVEVRLTRSSIPMSICRDRLSAGPLGLDLQHGRIRLEKAEMDFGGNGLLLHGIFLENLQIKRLLQDFPYDMTVSARDISAELKGQRLVFTGRITAQVAGGTIEATNIWLDPFAPIVHYGADIVFRGLDLRKLTAPTSFGVVSGAINGYIKGLVMSGVQPERFEFLLENDENSNEPKKISIKAVENLTILGGGEGSVSFLGYFFKEFSYSRIGISCSLSNDVFILHGLIKKGGKEYLVERGLLGGVNVINMNPGGRIRFKDMVERLKRITETDNSKMEVR